VLSRTTPNGPFPIQHTFVVQFAADTTLDTMGLTGRVEHLVSGQATRFRSVEALFAFMAARLREVQQTSPGEETEERHLQDQYDRKGSAAGAALCRRSRRGEGSERNPHTVASGTHRQARCPGHTPL
jgi:hypothetical protein